MFAESADHPPTCLDSAGQYLTWYCISDSQYCSHNSSYLSLIQWSSTKGRKNSLFSEEVKIVFMRLVKCMKNIDNFCSPLNKLCSIIKMLPILDNMCCSTKHWLMFRPTKNGVFLSRWGPKSITKYHLWLSHSHSNVQQLSQGCLDVAPSSGCRSVYTVCSKKIKKSSDMFRHFRQI